MKNLSSKTAIIITAMVCITVIVVVLVYSNNGDQHPADLSEQLVNSFEKEYGVKTNVHLSVHGASESQAESITKRFASKLTETEIEKKNYGGSEWFTAKNKAGEIELSVFLPE